MNERPLLHLAFRVEQSVYYKILETAERSKTSKSELLRKLINKSVELDGSSQEAAGTLNFERETTK